VFVVLKTIVVECRTPKLPSRSDEAASMAQSIGYEVIGTEVQNRRRVHGATCIGPGKLIEVKKLVEDKSVRAVIFANSLSGSQILKIEKVLGREVKVIDRNLLILEVFEKRAMTAEAKLQIELARLKYTFSWGREFIRMGGLSGQVGWSGPGEYPYVDYEREYRKRISHIESQLRDLYSQKDSLRERRHDLGFLVVALAGYTQSGKTTLFNRLSKESKTVGLGPFTTLSTSARRITVEKSSDKSSFILVDSIGFIEDMHPIILNAFNTTLGEILQADLILLFVDVSDDLPTLRRKLATSRKILMQSDVMSKIIVCANKVDRISEEALDNVKKEIESSFPALPIAAISATTGKDVDKLRLLVISTLEKIEQESKSTRTRP
jgi:GTP-binding protein HflX